MTWFDVARRLIRNAKHRCLVCGKDVNSPYVYCSIECACYDGTFNVRTGWKHKPSLFRGRCVPPKKRYESE